MVIVKQNKKLRRKEVFPGFYFSFPMGRKLRLTQQIRRSNISLKDNIKFNNS